MPLRILPTPNRLHFCELSPDLGDCSAFAPGRWSKANAALLSRQRRQIYFDKAIGWAISINDMNTRRPVPPQSVPPTRPVDHGKQLRSNTKEKGGGTRKLLRSYC